MTVVKTFYAHNELRNYSYLLLDESTGDSWVIDPYDSQRIIEFINQNGLNLRGILNTHQHFNHIKGNEALIEKFKAPVRKIKNAESIKVNETFTIESLDTPGHTLDHQVFIWKEKERPLALFSGDTLFNSGVGNCRGGGDVNLLFDTTKKLILNLPKETLLYPGHDYRKRNLEFARSIEPENKTVKKSLLELRDGETFSLPPVTLGEEQLVNPFLRLDSEEIRQTVNGTQADEKEVFIKLRGLRDNW